MRVTLEYLASAFILLLVVLAGFYTSTLGFNLASNSKTQLEASEKAHIIASNLASNPGIPYNWEANNTFQHLGLAAYSVSGEVSPSKVRSLLDIDPKTVWEYMKRVYGIKGFKLKLIPVLEVETPYYENSTHKWFEFKVYSNLHGIPVSNARIEYVLLYVEVRTTGHKVRINYTDTVEGVGYTDSEGKFELYVNARDSGGNYEEEYIVFARISYYGYRGIAYNSSGGASIGGRYVRYEFIINEYLEAEIVNNTLILYYKEEGPTNASVRIGETIYIYNGTWWEEWNWDDDPGESNNIITHGKGKNRLEIPLPEYVIPYAPLLVAIPASVSIGQGAGLVFTIIPAYYFAEEIPGGPIPEVEYGYGVGSADRNVAYVERIVDIAGTTYILEVVVST